MDVLKLEEQDFHRRDTSNPILITVTFTDLNPEAQEDFAHYYRQGKLVISSKAVFDSSSGIASVDQFGERLGIRAFRNFFTMENEKATVKALKEEYKSLKKEFGDLPPPGIKQQMIDELHTYEEKHQEACKLIPSKAEFYGFSKGQNRLEKHIQWVHLPAIKDAADERFESKGSALQLLLVSCHACNVG